MSGLGYTLAVALSGIDGQVVRVEAGYTNGLPAFVMVGLPDTSLHESRERVRAAVSAVGLQLPSRRFTVNLVPTALPKAGSGYDVAIALAILASVGAVAQTQIEGTVHVGELGLDGAIHQVPGVLPAVLAAAQAGVRRAVVPRECVPEARLVPGIEVVAGDHLGNLAARYGAQRVITVSPPPGGARPAESQPDRTPASGDFSDVRGQQAALEAAQVAAAGGHHMVLVGPPGAGKTMIASRMPGLLPDLPAATAVEVTSVHSLANRFDPRGGLITRPPFEAPHHTATAAAIVGGGSGLPRPGAASLAHGGILFLDEAPEFAPSVLQTLRQPLEHGSLTIHRAAGIARFPARFQLVMAANPCPCGYAGVRGANCTCSPMTIRRYQGRLSGPLLDRVDVHCAVMALRAVDLAGRPVTTTAQARERVTAAREVAAARLVGTPWVTNAQVPGRWLRQSLAPARALLADLDARVARGSLSMRAADRVLRLAWTVADLVGHTVPDASDLEQAIALRTTQGWR